MAGLTPFILWGIVLGCWLFLYSGARGRIRLLQTLAEKRSGSVRRRFSFMTMMPEALECLCPGRVGNLSCLFRIRFDLPRFGAASGTALELRAPLSIPEGEYLPADFLAGRRLVLGKGDFTEGYKALARAFPPQGKPSLSWNKEGVRCLVPALLGAQHELAAERCLLFLCELAAASEPS